MAGIKINFKHPTKTTIIFLCLSPNPVSQAGHKSLLQFVVSERSLRKKVFSLASNSVVFCPILICLSGKSCQIFELKSGKMYKLVRVECTG